MNIRIAPELKSEVRDIEPNLIHNRYDLLFGDNWEMVEIETNDTRIYVPVHIENGLGRVGLYLRDIGADVLRELNQFLFKNYDSLVQIFFLHTYTVVDDIEPAVHWHIDLPGTIEEFDSTLSHRVRYNSKWYPKKIIREVGEYIIDKIKPEQCTARIMQTYLDWKKQSHNFKWNREPLEYLKTFGVSDIFVMHVRDEILAIGFVCDTGGEEAFFENFAYNLKYRLYSPGIVLYHAIIADLIGLGKKRFCLLGGNLEYKRNYNGIATMTYTGLVYRDPKFIKLINTAAPKIKRIPISNCGRRRIAVMYSWLHGFPKFYKHMLKNEVRK